MLQQQLHCLFPFQGYLLTNGGKSRCHILGNLHIVKTNDGIVLRHPFSGFIEALNRPDCQNICRRNHTGCRQAGSHQLIGKLNAAVIINLAFKDILTTERNLKFPQRLLISQQAFFHNAVFLQLTGKEGYMLMSVLQHIAGGKIASVSIINADVVIIMVIAVAINQDNGNLGFLHLLIKIIGVHTNDNNAIQIAFFCKGQVALVGIRCGNQNVVSLLPGVILNAAKDFTIKAVLEHQAVARFCLGNHNADQLGIPHTQAPGIQIRHIVKRFDGFHHPAFGLFRNGTLTAKGIRNCCRRNARQLGHILECRSCHGIVLPSRLISLTV